MTAGYILIAVLISGIAAGVAVIFQASLWIAFGVYALVGSAVLLLLPVLFLAQGGAPAAFRGEIDRDDVLPHPHAMPERPGATFPASMRILAVDDDPFILELIPMLSAKAGFPDVTTAASGDEALRLLSDSARRFDCFLFDISMPGMDGTELCRLVRQMPRYAKTPVLMLTAMRDLKNMGNAYRAGASDYATKPFDIEELGTRLRLAHASGLAGHEPRQHGVGNLPGVERKNGVTLPTGVAGLVDGTALASYLTQLPRREVSGIHIYAIALDGLEALQTGSSPRKTTAALEEASRAVASCFDSDGFIMAYADPATLLVASSATAPPVAISIEAKIETWLRNNGYELGVSVGGPVLPHGSKAERARVSMDGARARAELRAHEKSGAPDIDMPPKKSPRDAEFGT